MKPIAKGKKRRAEVEEETEVIAKWEKEQLKPKVKADKSVKHRDEISSGQIMNIMADEIEAIGEETGVTIDRTNARDFYAYNLWIDLKFHHGVTAREKEVPHVLCRDHK